MSKKSQWYDAEQVVKEYYTDQWRTFLCQNRTIRGGEIDLIMKSSHEVCFIEVKSVHRIDDLHDYITQSKLRALQRAVETWYHRTPWSESFLPRVDVVFVKDNAILHIFEYISL